MRSWSVLLAVSVLIPFLVFDGLVVDGLMFSSTVEVFGALLFGLAEVSFGVNGAEAGAVPTEGMALNNVSPSMWTSRIFATFDISYKHLTSFLWLLC